MNSLPPEDKRVLFNDWIDETKYHTNPIQREYKKRAERLDIIERFNPWQSIHWCGDATILLNDSIDENNGIVYPAGTTFKLDMHTRPLVILNGSITNVNPKWIDDNGGFKIRMQKANDIPEVKKQYKQIDSQLAVEKRKDAMYSAFYNAYLNESVAQPDNPAFMKSQPLSYAAHYTFGEDKKNRTGFKSDSGLDQETLSHAVKMFMPAFDQLENITFNTKKKKSNKDMGNVGGCIKWDSWLMMATLMVGHSHNFDPAWFGTVVKINDCVLDGYDVTGKHGSTALGLICNEWNQNNSNCSHPDKRLNKGQLGSALIDQLFFLFDMAISEPNKRFKSIAGESSGYFDNYYKYKLQPDYINPIMQSFAA